jgi:arylsulfatase A-like enzyme
MKSKTLLEKPNVVLICADQWRGDCLSAAGHPFVHTPYLDDLSVAGCRFVSAYSAAPSCIPARAALFTGRTQRTHGRVGYQDGVPWNYQRYLAEEFTNNGYQTQAIGKMHVFPERSQCGFQNVILHDGHLHFARKNSKGCLEIIDDYTPWLREKTGNPNADYFEHGLSCNSFVARPWDKAEELHPTNFVVTQGIDFLRRRDPRKPFFLYLSFHRPHPPLDPPAWALEQYLDMEIPEPPVGGWASLFAEHYSCRSDLSAGKLRPDVFRRARAAYYASITHIDHQINRFIEYIGDYGLAENTIFCFVSDHGELLGDHNLFRKTLPYEGSAKIPMIFKGPGIPAGAISSVPSELRDVMPTLLFAAGLPIPDIVEGENLLSAMNGNNEGYKKYIHGEHPTLGQSYQWLTDGKTKYIWMSKTGIEQLFDLENDAQELRDISKSEPELLKHWRQILIKELKGREEGFSDGTKLVKNRPVKPTLNHVFS